MSSPSSTLRQVALLTFLVTALVAALAPSAVSAKAPPPPPPVQPPQNLVVVSVSDDSISVDWQRSKDALAYALFRDGRIVDVTAATDATFDDLTCATRYRLGVLAIALWDLSAPAEVTATTAACPDRKPPSSPPASS